MYCNNCGFINRKKVRHCMACRADMIVVISTVALYGASLIWGI